MAFTETFLFYILATAAIYGIKAVSSWVSYLFNEYIFTNHPKVPELTHNPNYSLHEKDKEYVEESKRVLNETLGETPVQRLLETKDAEERVKAVSILTRKLAEVYGLEDVSIEFVCDEKSNICGFYNREDHKIVLNVAHLLTNNEILVKDFLDTIFHEFRHAVQWKMVCSNSTDDYKWYTDEQRVHEYAENFVNYIGCNTDPKGYFEQPVECDAREIALYILEDQK